MIIKNVIKNASGTYSMNVQASGEEMDFLTGFAVNLLIVAGTISLKEDANGNVIEDQEISVLKPEGTTLQ